MDELSYNGKNFSDFNTFFDGSKAFGSPEKDYELVEIMGRNGSLSIYNDRFKDILLPFPCFVRTNFLPSYRGLTQFLNSQHGYKRLETTKEPNHYRMALFQGIVEPQTTPFNHGGLFTINFLSKPQRYLKSGEEKVTITADTTINNPTLFPAYPLIRIFGSGTVTINNQVITISAHSLDYIDINCDLMDAYCGATNANQYVSFSDNEYITLQSGVNGIELDDVTSIEITPNWYEI